MSYSSHHFIEDVVMGSVITLLFQGCEIMFFMVHNIFERLTPMWCSGYNPLPCKPGVMSSIRGFCLFGQDFPRRYFCCGSICFFVLESNFCAVLTLCMFSFKFG